jgi:hypothetical protein
MLGILGVGIICLPPVTLLLVFFELVGRHMTFGVPLCAVHARPFLARFWFIPLAAALLTAVFVASVATSDVGDLAERQPRSVGESLARSLRNYLIPASLAGMIVLLGVAYLLHGTHRPRASQVGDLSITLEGVAPDFVRAYEDMRRPMLLPKDVGDYWSKPADRVPTKPSNKLDGFQRGPD